MGSAERRRLGVLTGSEQGPGSRFGQLAIGHYPAPVDEDMVDAFGPGVETSGTAREIEAHGNVTTANGGGIEHHEVGVPAFGDAPTVLQPVQTTLDIGQEVDRLFEREELVTPDSLTEEFGGVVERSQEVQVGTRIGGADNGTMVPPDFEARRPVLVAFRLRDRAEAGVEVVRHHYVAQDVPGVPS